MRGIYHAKRTLKVDKPFLGLHVYSVVACLVWMFLKHCHEVVLHFDSNVPIVYNLYEKGTYPSKRDLKSYLVSDLQCSVQLNKDVSLTLAFGNTIMAC